MALREFTDANGHDWAVWDVYPSRNYDKLLAGLQQPTPAGDAAWLAFECRATGERRRLAPVPRDWSASTDADLLMLCGSAERLPKKRRARLIE